MQKKIKEFSPNAKIRKVWISKQYLTYRNDLVAKAKHFACREKGKNGKYLYHLVEDSKHETKN